MEEKTYLDLDGGHPTRSRMSDFAQQQALAGNSSSSTAASLGKTPSSNDACANIVQHLMCFHTGRDEEFSRKAIESLIKKMKDKRDELDALIQSVISSGKTATKCVTIQRTLDGRLQVAGRKGFPHVVYARIWRWPDLHKNELKHTHRCQYAFDMKADLVCVNPYHYERVVSPGIGNIDLSTLRIDVAGTPMAPSLDHHHTSPYQHHTSATSPVEALLHQQQQQQAALEQQQQQLLTSVYGAPPASIAQPNHSPSDMPRANIGYGDPHLLSPKDEPGDMHFPPSSNEDLLANLQMQQQHWQDQALGNVHLNQYAAGPSSSASVVVPPSPAMQSSGNDAQFQIALHAQPPPDNWCTIAYHEQDTSVGEIFKVASTIPAVLVDGGVDPSDSGRLCIGALSNVHRDQTCENARKHIGKGVRLEMRGDGDVWLQCLGEKAVFVQSYYLDKQAGRTPGDAVHKIYQNAFIQVFDLRQCYMEMQQQALCAQAAVQAQAAAVSGRLQPADMAHGAAAFKGASIGVDDLRRLCVIRVSFVKGWGPEYPRSSIKQTPCWIEVQLNRGLQLLDQFLHSMNTPLSLSHAPQQQQQQQQQQQVQPQREPVIESQPNQVIRQPVSTSTT